VVAEILSAATLYTKANFQHGVAEKVEPHGENRENICALDYLLRVSPLIPWLRGKSYSLKLLVGFET
jgi:hypothetical protein